MSGVESLECDKLKEELIGLGLYEDGMNVDDMIDLMAAIRNSQDSALKEQRIRDSNKKVEASRSSNPIAREGKRGMERRYKNVPDRRMPWNLFPFPDQLSLEQKSQILAAYKEQLTLCQYRKAKTSSIFTEWNSVFKIPFKVSSEYKSSSGHHTRSGRTLKSTPHYVDDDSDMEGVSILRKPRKKIRKLTNEEIISKSSLFRDINVINVEGETDKTVSISETTGDNVLATNDREDTTTYISSPEYGNDNEETKGSSRKRARLQKDSSIE